MKRLEVVNGSHLYFSVISPSCGYPELCVILGFRILGNQIFNQSEFIMEFMTLRETFLDSLRESDFECLSLSLYGNSGA